MQLINEVKDTRNFKATEFACTCDDCKKLLNSYWTADQFFIDMMQAFREFVNYPFDVTCGIRCKDKKSNHSKNAVDGYFWVGYNDSGEKVRLTALQIALLAEEFNRKNFYNAFFNKLYNSDCFKGIGIYFEENGNEFVHLDPYFDHDMNPRRWARINGVYTSYREGILFAEK